MFKDIEGDLALIRKGGVFKTVPIAVKTTGEVFLRIGAGSYVRVYENGSTSQPGTMVNEMHTELQLFKDSHGRLTSDAAKGTAIGTDARQRLLLGSD